MWQSVTVDVCVCVCVCVCMCMCMNISVCKRELRDSNPIRTDLWKDTPWKGYWCMVVIGLWFLHLLVGGFKASWVFSLHTRAICWWLFIIWTPYSWGVLLRTNGTSRCHFFFTIIIEDIIYIVTFTFCKYEWQSVKTKASQQWSPGNKDTVENK